MRRRIFVAAFVLLTGSGTYGDEKTYSDPDRAFTLKLDGEWTIDRDRAKDHTSTSLRNPSGSAILNVHVYPMGKYADALKTPKLDPKIDREAFEKTAVVELSKPFMDVWVDGAKGQFQEVRTGKIVATKFQDRRAARGEIKYKGKDGKPRTGYAIFFIGEKNVFFITMTSRDSAGTEQVDAALKSLDVEKDEKAKEGKK